MTQPKLTEAQERALGLLGVIGQVYPSKTVGSTATYEALVRKGLVLKVGHTFAITPAGREALRSKT